MTYEKIKVVVICPCFFQGNAVGVAAWKTYQALNSYDRYDVTALWFVNDYNDLSGEKIETVADLLTNPHFLAADVIIYIFAAYHEFFDALLIGNGKAKQIVRFHNVTPRHLMPKKHWNFIDRSFAQIQNLQKADEIWADSYENFQELVRQGILEEKIVVIPLAVHFPIFFEQSKKPSNIIEMLYVGRICESKCVHEIIHAAEKLKSLSRFPFKLNIVGNLRFSDPDYVESIQNIINERQLQDTVNLIGSADEEQLRYLYKRANIYLTGSRHEGFCIPIIEALAAGCIPVNYGLANLRYIANGWGRIAKTDTPGGLVAEILDLMEPISASRDPNRLIKLDRGQMTIKYFDTEVAKYVKKFSFSRFSETLARQVRYLTL